MYVTGVIYEGAAGPRVAGDGDEPRFLPFVSPEAVRMYNDFEKAL